MIRGTWEPGMAGLDGVGSLTQMRASTTPGLRMPLAFICVSDPAPSGRRKRPPGPLSQAFVNFVIFAVKALVLKTTIRVPAA